MILLNDSNPDWWYVRHLKNGEGFVPKNFVSKMESLESEEWYAGEIQRSTAEDLVLAAEMPRGTFLVRKREGGEYALTINDLKYDSLDVKHYKIRPLDNASGFYITTHKVFPTVRDLILYYSKPKVIAIYEYQNHVKGDICFDKGDVMILLNDSNPDWWYVRHLKNGEGYAPKNFLAKMESLESEEWYAGKIQRSTAEKLVLAGKMPRGTFLVRKREGGEYALTINDLKDDSLDVKHYKIRPLDNASGFYITTRKVFPTVRDLIFYYSKEPGGLCCRLTYPAQKIAPVRPDLSYDTAKNWEIPREELQLVKRLGDGNFATVYLGRWRGVIEVAVKMLKPGTMSVEAFLEEAQIMKQCNHPKLVRLYAVCTVGEPYYIITEFMRNGSLLHYLRNLNNRLSIHALVDTCAQVASGMMYLESRKLVHRDLAARNVLVGDKISGVPEVKVADFGLARKLMDENIYEAQLGAKFPIKWTAPEAAQYGNFTVKSDVWSYGILLNEIFTFGTVPYPTMHNKEVIAHLEEGYRMPCPKGCPEAIYLEMLKCWDRNPDKRPTFEYLFTFFDDFFISSQPNYVPPSVDGVPFEVHSMDTTDEGSSNRMPK
uniref:Tyrosine-protein kinase n=1 Tax=Meloidogyne incognita TaxID=6306 RepID=A0A914L316_MELIC